MRAYDESVRESFLQLIVDGRTITSASTAVGIHRSTGSAWLRRFSMEAVTQENAELRRVDGERKRELETVNTVNDLLRRDNNELRAEIWQMRSAARPRHSVVKLLLAGLRWLVGALGAGVISEVIGVWAAARKADTA